MALRTQQNLNKENTTLAVAAVKQESIIAKPLTRPALTVLRSKNIAEPSKKKPLKVEVFNKNDVIITRSKAALQMVPQSPSPMECDTDALSLAFSMKILPSSILDVDAIDKDNPQMVHEYVKDIFVYLRSLETQFPIQDNFLNEQKEINSRMRGILVDWLVQVHQRFSLLQETLFLTVAILDRFLQVQQVSKSHLQLVGVTSMYLAGKYEEMYPAEVNDFVYITDNAYTKKEIFKMEMAVLRGLTFDLCRPLPIHFLRRYSKVGNCEATVHQMAKYLMELSMPDYSFCQYVPSHLAAAALCLSLRLLEEGEESEWSDTLTFYSGYEENQLLDLVKKLASLLSKAETAKLQSIRTKYSHNKFGKISLHPATKSSILSKFAC